jgi:hypothetical protein
MELAKPAASAANVSGFLQTALSKVPSIFPLNWDLSIPALPMNASRFRGIIPPSLCAGRFVLSRGCDDPQNCDGYYSTNDSELCYLGATVFRGLLFLLSPQILSNHFFEIGVFSSASNRGNASSNFRVRRSSAKTSQRIRASVFLM